MAKQKILFACGLVGAGIGSYAYYEANGRKQLSGYLVNVDPRLKSRSGYHYKNFISSIQHKSLYEMTSIFTTRECWNYMVTHDEETLSICPDEFMTRAMVANVGRRNLTYITTNNERIIDAIVERIANEKVFVNGTDYDEIRIKPCIMREVIEKLKKQFPHTWKGLLLKIDNPILSPEELEMIYPGPYYKVVHPNRPHYTMEYTEDDAVYTDSKPFDNHMCYEGGIHASNKENMLNKWIFSVCEHDDKCIILDVHIPEDTLCAFGKNKFKCPVLELRNGRDVETFKKEVATE